MLSVCSSSSRQRSTSASSSSSISSKSPLLATASLVKGHNLSAGCSSGEPEGRNSRVVSLPGSQPLCRCASRPDLLPKARACALRLLPLFGELIECHREQLHIDRGQ